MLLRRLVTSLAPLLLCLLTCIVFRWLDGLMDSGNFFLFVLKGFALGLCIGLLLPIAGISTRANGLIPWLYTAIGMILLLLLYQYLESIRLVHWPILKTLITINGQVILVESTVVGFLLVTALLHPKR